VSKKTSKAASRAFTDILSAGAKGVLIITVDDDMNPEMTTNIERESCMEMLRHILDPDNQDGMTFPGDMDPPSLAPRRGEP
jgi:hypothetical protein